MQGIGLSLVVIGVWPGMPAHANDRQTPRVIIEKREQDTRRQAYVPKGYLIAGLRLDLGIEEHFGATDNVYAEGKGGQAAWFLTTTPTARVATQGDRPLHLTLDASVTDVRAPGTTELSRTDGHFAISAQAESRNRSRVRMDASWRRAHDVPGDPDLPGAAVSPVGRAEWTLSGDGLWRSGHWLTGMGGSLRRLDHDDVGRRGGGTIDQDDRDRWEVVTTGRMGLAPTSALDVFIEGWSEQRSYDRLTSALGLNRLSSGQGVVGGLAVDLTGLLFVEIKIGEYQHLYASPYFAPVEATVWDGILTWAITPLTTIRARGVRQVEETAAEGYSGVIADRWTLGAEHEVLRNLMMTIGGEIGQRTYQGPAPDRTDDLLTLHGDVMWRLDNRWSLGLDGKFEQRRSTFDVFDYNRLTVGFRAGADL